MSLKTNRNQSRLTKEIGRTSRDEFSRSSDYCMVVLKGLSD
jgi:hypothetical protein